MSWLHAIGYEKEEHFHNVLGKVTKQHHHFKAKLLSEIISNFAPEFLVGLFEDRQCVRQLKYIGCKNIDIATREDGETQPFFEIGKVYQSRSFNGGTYSIEGYERRIGSVYFEVA